MSAILFCIVIAAVEAGAPTLPIGRATTFVDGPLHADGYIDYAAAINAHFGRGVKADENALALLWQALGPAPVDEAIRAPYFAALGIAPPPDEGTYFVTLETFINERVESYERREVIEKECESTVLRRAWRAVDYPEIAAWLEQNDAALATAVAASRRPQFFDPLIAADTEHGRQVLGHCARPASTELGELTRSLVARALLRLAAGRADEAWQDLLAAHRLGRLFTRGPTVYDFRFGCATSMRVHEASVALTEHASWTADDFRRATVDLAALPPPASLVEKFDLYERCKYLDTARGLRTGDWDMLEDLWGTPAIAQFGPDEFRRRMRGCDGAMLLRRYNACFDRLVAALRMTDAAAKSEALDRIETEYGNALPRDGLPRLGYWLDLIDGTPAVRAEALIDFVMSADLFVLPVHVSAIGEIEQRITVAETALVLAAFHRATGRYPQSLDELVPTYLARVPLDRYAGEPLKYRTFAEGYVLYSVGRDGRDDEGRPFGNEDDRDHDDLSVVVPQPE